MPVFCCFDTERILSFDRRHLYHFIHFMAAEA
jgi:hypothetical protein